MLAADATTRCKPLFRQLALAIDARAALMGVTLAGFTLRLALLDRFAFHPDEAIYSFWALYGRHVDPLFLHVWPDKPPVLIWLLGWLFELVGATPVVARLPNLVFSTLTVVIIGALARRWWGERAGLLAALLMALNPFAISFAATAFTDPLMVMAGLLALYTAVRRRYFWSGLWLGVAMMTKQQGVLFAPLVLTVASGELRGVRNAAAAVLHWLVGLMVVVAPILYWDSLRWAVAPSPWDLGARNAASFVLTAQEQWLPRLWAWLALARYLFGEVWIWFLLLGGVIVSFNCAAAPLRREHPVQPVFQFPPAAILLAWAVGFLALHVATTVQVWDRYLLPLAPVVALLGAFVAEWALRRGEGRVARRETSVLRTWRRRMPSVIVVLLVVWLLLLTGSAIEAARGRVPVGGDRGAYTGVEQVAAWLAAQA
ncbi:MAG: ArnT family glycosyltransferase, partial [Caldilinea sp.]